MIHRKIILLLSALLFVLGCFDFTIVQYIEQQKDKSLIITVRATSPFLKEKKKSTVINEDEFKNKIVTTNITLLSSRYIEDDLAGTYEFVFKAKQLPSKLESTLSSPFLPYKDKNGQYIFFSLGTSELKQPSNNDLFDTKEIAETMLAAAKYRLAFGNITPNKALIIVNRKQIEKFNLSIYQMGNVYCIDIPMNLMFMNESAVIVSFTNNINDSEISNYLTELRKKREQEEKKYREEQQKKDETEKLNEDKNNNDTIDKDDYNEYENDSGINNDKSTGEDTNIHTDSENIE
ncbi:MAG: hypothetical protein N3F66_14985 [Spirochaetes bacterium]|nr:hypothetical protein [Spirochaetota bacterium]